MAAGLSDLPEELLIQILSFLRKRDLKSARVACIRWGRLGAEWLFHRVYFAPRQAAMQDFLSIAANPRFSKKVEALTYDGRLFIPILNRTPAYDDAYKKVVSERKDSGIRYGMDDWYPKLLDVPVKDSRIQYLHLLDKQQEILKDEKDSAALHTGLQSFQNLSRVTICDDFSQYRYVPASNGNYYWYYQRSAQDFGLAIAPAGWNEYQMHQVGAAKWEWDNRGVHHLFEALAMHSPNIKNMCLGSSRSSIPFSIFDLEDENRDNMYIVAKRLQRFEVYSSPAKDDSEEVNDSRHDRLWVILNLAQNLDYLACEGHMHSEVFHGQYWPHLTEFKIGDMEVWEEDLISFAEAHKSTLRVLSLRDIYLDGDQTWEQVAKVMSKSLRLDSLWIASLADDTTVAAINSYLGFEPHRLVAHAMMQGDSRPTCIVQDLHGAVRASVMADVKDICLPVREGGTSKDGSERERTEQEAGPREIEEA